MITGEKEVPFSEAFAIAEAQPIEVPGLLPDIPKSGTGEVVEAGNMLEKLTELHAAVNHRPWFKKLLRDVRAGEKSAVVKVVLGGVIVTAALGAGFEFGIRHGQDITEFAKLLRKKLPKQDSK